MRRTFWLVGALAIASSSHVARAQTEPQTSLLVLDTVGAPDAATGEALRGALASVGRAAGYRVLTPGRGSVVGSLDPAHPDDLVSIAARTDVHRALVVWITPAEGRVAVRIGLAGADQTAVSVRAVVGASDVVAAAMRGLASVLVAPSTPLAGAWAEEPAVAVESPAPSEPPAARAVPRVSSTSDAPIVDDDPHPRRPRSHHARNTAMVGSGIGLLGGGWLFGLVVGLFGGYHDHFCVDLGWLHGCSGPPSSFDPAWDDFRALSLVPIAGPWLQLGAKPPSDDGWPVWLVFDGVLQGAGVVVLVLGIVFSAEGDGEPPPVAVLPMLGPGLVGLTIGGAL